MLELINNVMARVTNFITVLSDELNPLPIEILLGGSLWFFALYFVSRWFKAYVIRLLLFIAGVSLIYSVMGRSHIITSIDLYAGLGLAIPHIEIVELTYLILRERTLFLVDKIIELFYLVISPFIWVYQKFLNIFYFLQIKQTQRSEKKAEKEYYKEEFKRQQEKARAEEQARYDEADINEQNKREKEYKYKKKDKEKPQQPKEEPKTYSRWDSSNPYEILGISENSTKQEIKKAYRNLAKIYHPDLTLTKEEEYTVILQKINEAYEELK
ncbi:MAG: DnaJ-class molecular chaperone CbpA [uncultured Sulfurovum sp.]|uniref:DnaJ-class molecular chaperone CbpA n=1 Tax=uncultured Sulfurovum sp. TaxID=269237 RepID=A0A6S6SQ49_9BACT|nr:MAG: DnaJ-class molecular chaperone CbpA [uncultured Sulfurovum sp.]